MTNDAESIRVEGKTLDEWFNARFDECMAQREANRQKMLSMLVTKGTLDWAYTTYIIASTDPPP